MKSKTKNIILGILTAIIVSAIPAIIFGKWVEAIIFVLCHTFIRPQFEKEYHHILPSICRTITAIVFFFGISFVLPIEISLMSAIPICYFIGWVGCNKAQRDYYERKFYELQEKFCNNEQELLRKCRLAKLSERDTILAQMYLVEKKTPKDIWLWLCEQKYYEKLEWDSIYVILYRITKKVEKIK